MTTCLSLLSEVVAHTIFPLRSWFNLLLLTLQRPPFEPTRNCPLSILTCNDAFHIAITSARQVYELAALTCTEPFLVLHKGKIVLRHRASFLLKVFSSFQLNQDIVLPSFCPDSKHSKEISLHCLDVVCAVRVYFFTRAPFQQFHSPFFSPEGHHSEQPVSCFTIARKIQKLVIQA